MHIYIYNTLFKSVTDSSITSTTEYNTIMAYLSVTIKAKLTANAFLTFHIWSRNSRNLDQLIWRRNKYRYT